MNMLFDKVAGIVEKYIKNENILKMMDEARIFCFEQDCESHTTDEAAKFMNSDYRPYESMCVSYDGKFVSTTTICMNDKYLHYYPMQGGEYGILYYLKFNGVDTEKVKVVPTDIWIEANGKIIDCNTPLGRASVAAFHNSFSNGKKVSEVMMDTFFYAMALINKINEPTRFIVEDAPTHRKWVRNGRILRSPDRPIYTVLTPGEIRKRYAPHTISTETNGTTKAPHERRGHMRTYRDERYKAMLGKQQWIPACWVGPSEFPVGKRIYRVILDR